MKKTLFSKVFSHQIRFVFPRISRAWITYWLTGTFVIVFLACAKPVPQLPVIASIDGNPVYLNELEMLGRLAASEKGVDFDSPEGQMHYRSIAPNLYKTLIDLYVMKYSAEKEGFLPSPEEVEAEFVRFSENLKSQGIYEEFLKQVQVDEPRLKETLRDRLAIQKLQKVKLEQQEAVVTDQELRDFYNQNARQFRYPNRMRISHIFVGSPQTDSAEKREQARIRAEQMRKMIGNDPSKTFVGLAREHSEDPYTSSRGGDMGFISPGGNLIPAFEKAAFALKEGEVSAVVDSGQGFHILWATDYEQSFEEAENQVREMKIQQKKGELFAQWLEEAAKQLNIVYLFDPLEFKIKTEGTATPARKEPAIVPNS